MKEDSELGYQMIYFYQGSVYNHTRVSLPSSHTHVVVSETQGFGYSATRLMTAQSKGCTAMLLGQYSKYSLTE